MGGLVSQRMQILGNKPKVGILGLCRVFPLECSLTSNNPSAICLGVEQTEAERAICVLIVRCLVPLALWPLVQSCVTRNIFLLLLGCISYFGVKHPFLVHNSLHTAISQPSTVLNRLSHGWLYFLIQSLNATLPQGQPGALFLCYTCSLPGAISTSEQIHAPWTSFLIYKCLVYEFVSRTIFIQTFYL